MPNTEFRFAALQTPAPGANSRRLMGVVMRYDVPGIGPGGMLKYSHPAHSVPYPNWIFPSILCTNASACLPVPVAVGWNWLTQPACSP